ncbi:hypothetical protein HYQ44_010147 [Verticillium longisporum]|nr:hypothetical protein HYQ44_010147 [Verticillium longisporum]
MSNLPRPPRVLPGRAHHPANARKEVPSQRRPAKRAAVENRNVTKPARSVERAKSSNSTAGIGNRSPQKKTKRYLRFWTV